MRAMTITDFGGLDVFKLQDVPEPTLQDRDLLVEVHATAVNPIDCKVRQGGLGGERELPAALGFDVSGVVRAVGPGVQRFQVGDEVYASPSLARPGANAELVAIDERTAAIKPGNVDHPTAAALPLVTITAWECLHRRSRLHSRETVLIQGGGGGVGHIALQLAKLHNCRVLTTASSDASIDLCRQLGADQIINYQKEDVVERVLQITGNHGCEVVVDTVGGDVFNQCLDCVAIHGRLVTILAPPQNAPIQKLFLRDASIDQVFMGASTMFDTRPETQGEILQTVTELVEADKLLPHIAHRFTLEQMADAHRQQETGHTTGKIVVTVK